MIKNQQKAIGSLSKNVDEKVDTEKNKTKWQLKSFLRCTQTQKQIMISSKIKHER